MILVFFLPAATLCQEMEGRWTGILSQQINGNFAYEMELTRTAGKAVFGTTSSAALNGPFKGNAKFRLTLRNLGDNTFSYQDEGILDSTSQTNYFWCKKTATLKLTTVNDTLVLSGAWVSATGSCPPGTLVLKKSLRQRPAPPAVPIVVPPARVAPERVYVRKKQISVRVWDFDTADGDSVAIRINGKGVGPDKIALLLARNVPGKEGMFPVELQPGENILEIKALNAGSKPKNTVAVLITDEVSGEKFYFSLEKNQAGIIRLLRI